MKSNFLKIATVLFGLLFAGASNAQTLADYMAAMGAQVDDLTARLEKLEKSNGGTLNLNDTTYAAIRKEMAKYFANIPAGVVITDKATGKRIPILTYVMETLKAHGVSIENQAKDLDNQYQRLTVVEETGRKHTAAIDSLRKQYAIIEKAWCTTNDALTAQGKRLNDVEVVLVDGKIDLEKSIVDPAKYRMQKLVHGAYPKSSKAPEIPKNMRK